MKILISVVICTHNRATYLTRAIQSLIDQKTPKDNYEIIVVDNCSTDHTKQMVEQYYSMGNIRYMYEPTLGLSHARNTGWRNAKGKYVAYLDDDAVASTVWLNKIIEVFETITPRPGCVGGKVVPIWEANRPVWLSDWLLHGLAITDWPETPHVLNNLATEWLVGANIAFPVEILERMNGFTSNLDRSGNNLLSSGDVFLEKQIIKMGCTCFYHPEIAVSHHIFKSRLTKEWFIRRYYWQGISDAVMQILELKPSLLMRLRLVFSEVRSFLKSPGKFLTLLSPTNDPDSFTQKCFAYISLGYMYGLLKIKNT